VPGFAKVEGVAIKPLKEPVVKTVKFEHATRVNRKMVGPGEYKLTAKGYELKFEAADGKTVAVSPITWRRVDHTFDDTKMDIDHDVLTKVNLGGTHEAVLLHTSK
jgi:hypothetical protein